MVKCTGRGLVVKRPGVLIKVQMLTLVLGVGVFSPLPNLPKSGAVGSHFGLTSRCSLLSVCFVAGLLTGDKMMSQGHPASIHGEVALPRGLSVAALCTAAESTIKTRRAHQLVRSENCQEPQPNTRPNYEQNLTKYGRNCSKIRAIRHFWALELGFQNDST